jgi:hypothetical protein
VRSASWLCSRSVSQSNAGTIRTRTEPKAMCRARSWPYASGA